MHPLPIDVVTFGFTTAKQTSNCWQVTNPKKELVLPHRTKTGIVITSCYVDAVYGNASEVVCLVD